MFIQSRNSLKNHTRESVYPFSDQNRAKTLLDGAAHTYIAYIMEFPPGLISIGSLTTLLRECASVDSKHTIY